jgi:type IV pilus assembly protein PilV
MLMSANKPQQGFSLVEVLIALVIMSVGMLGIATLFVQGMQAGRTSMFRHNAVILVGDVANGIARHFPVDAAGGRFAARRHCQRRLRWRRCPADVPDHGQLDRSR